MDGVGAWVADAGAVMDGVTVGTPDHSTEQAKDAMTAMTNAMTMLP